MQEQTTATGAVERGSTTFTPGPWVATPDCTSEHDEGRFIAISQPGHTAGVIAKLPNYAREEAALIAAAPDLYEALVRIRSYITHGEGSDPGGLRLISARELADQVLAKARGELVPA